MVDAGCLILDAGWWVLDAGYWMLEAGYWKLDAGGCWMVDENSSRLKVEGLKAGGLDA